MAETQVPLYPTSQQSPILPQYSEVVQNIQPVIAFVPSADEKVINYRWASLKVSSIECVNITNQTFYTENETAIVNGLAGTFETLISCYSESLWKVEERRY